SDQDSRYKAKLLDCWHQLPDPDQPVLRLKDLVKCLSMVLFLQTCQVLQAPTAYFLPNRISQDLGRFVCTFLICFCIPPARQFSRLSYCPTVIVSQNDLSRGTRLMPFEL